MKHGRFQSVSKFGAVSWSLFWILFWSSSDVFADFVPKVQEFSSESEISESADDLKDENLELRKEAIAGKEIVKAASFSNGILPPKILEAGKEKFSPNIQKSFTPGIAFESLHFEVEPDFQWGQNTIQLSQVLKKVEEIRHEADLTASLWRQPFFVAKLGTGGISLTLNKEQVPYQTLIPAKRMRLRVVSPLPEAISAYSTPSPCRLEYVRGEICLTIAISSIQDFQEEKFLRNVREVLFRSALHEGKEDRIFPVWVQAGLSSVFAGGMDCENEFSKNPLLLSDLTEISRRASELNRSDFRNGDERKTGMGQDSRLLEEDLLFKGSSALWVRYFLGANSGKTFFSFWGILNQICSFTEKEFEHREQWEGEKQTRNLSFEKSISVITPQIQRETWEWMRSLENLAESRNDRAYPLSGGMAILNYSDSVPQSFREWCRDPNSEEILVREVSEVPVLNAVVFGNQPLPCQPLSEDQREAFSEMALLLQIVGTYRKENSGNFQRQGKTEDGILIQEVGKPKELRKFSAIASGRAEENPSSVSISESSQKNAAEDLEKKNEEDPRKVTAEDLQRLEDVYDWFKSGDLMNRKLFFDFDGYPVSPILRHAEAEKLFHPQNKALLLQEYEGNPVLSATFTDGSVLHVILEEAKEKEDDSEKSESEIRIFGMEVPENSEETESDVKP